MSICIVPVVPWEPSMKEVLVGGEVVATFVTPCYITTADHVVLGGDEVPAFIRRILKHGGSR